MGDGSVSSWIGPPEEDVLDGDGDVDYQLSGCVFVRVANVAGEDVRSAEPLREE